MTFEQALTNMKMGHKVIRAVVIDDPCTVDYCWVIYDNQICRLYVENGLICNMPLTEGDILANDWEIFIEEDIS
jgi:hypothetical protein